MSTGGAHGPPASRSSSAFLRAASPNARFTRSWRIARSRKGSNRTRLMVFLLLAGLMACATDAGAEAPAYELSHLAGAKAAAYVLSQQGGASAPPHWLLGLGELGVHDVAVMGGLAPLG